MDRVLLVTGSTRGIGRTLVGQLLPLGAKVVIHGRDEASARAARASWNRPDQTAAVWGDLSDRDAAIRAVEAAATAWGRLDVIINNAGRSMRGPWAEVAPVTVQHLWNANFLAALWTTQAALRYLELSRGHVCFVSTLASLRGFPGAGLYSATKAALGAFQESLEAEVRSRGISTGIVYLPFVENDPDKTILSSDGVEFRHSRPSNWTQTRAADTILRAVRRRHRRSVPTLGKILRYVNALFPSVVDVVLRRSLGRVHRVTPKGT